MEFSESILTEAHRSIEDGINQIIKWIDEIPRLVSSAIDHFYIPDVVKTLVVKAGQFLIDCFEKAVKKVQEVMLGMLAPFTMWNQHNTWNDVQGKVSAVGSTLGPDALKVGREWSGEAADSYAKTASGQSAAVDRVAAVASSVADALRNCAVGGMVFGVAVAGAIGMFVVEAAAETAATASVVGAPPAAVAGGVSTVKVIGLIVAAVTALVSLLGTQVAGMGTIESELNDATAMPGNHWPDPQGKSFSDATVTDGDADWSVRD